MPTSRTTAAKRNAARIAAAQQLERDILLEAPLKSIERLRDALNTLTVSGEAAITAFARLTNAIEDANTACARLADTTKEGER